MSAPNLEVLRAFLSTAWVSITVEEVCVAIRSTVPMFLAMVKVKSGHFEKFCDTLVPLLLMKPICVVPA